MKSGFANSVGSSSIAMKRASQKTCSKPGKHPALVGFLQLRIAHLSAVKKFQEEPRDRFVTSIEMPRLLEAIDQHSSYWTKDIFLLCLFTAQRLQNVCSMQWRDVDLTAGTWKIPSRRFKTGVSHIVPLVNEAIKILKERRNTHAFVFPGRRNRQTHTAYPYSAWRKVLKAAGLDDLHIHDLRRTHATWLADRGESVITIAKVLGHTSFQSTAIYAKRQVETQRQAMQSASTAMSAFYLPPPTMLSTSIENRALTDTGTHVASTSPQKKTCIAEETVPSLASRKNRKNANVKISPADQIIIEAKILTSIRVGGTSKKKFL